MDMPCRRRTAISTLNSNVSISSSLKTASFTHGGSVLHWQRGIFTSVLTAKVLGCIKYYFNILDDDVAENVLEIHRNQMNHNGNPYYYILAEDKELSEQRDAVQRLLMQLNDCMKD